ncbi:MAG: hypothetical protein ACKOC4_02705 [Planctomycetia bacterium]
MNAAPLSHPAEPLEPFTEARFLPQVAYAGDRLSASCCRVPAPKEPAVKTKPAVEFRVVKLPSTLVEAMRRRRDADGTSNLRFLGDAVTRHLSATLSQLREIGITAGKGTKQAVRLPFSPQAGTLATLKTASRETGLSATQLLAICLVSATKGAAAPKHSRKSPAAKPSRPKSRS